MTAHIDDILILKSDIKTDSDKHRVSSLFEFHPLIEGWSVDIEDADHVLRIISRTLKLNNIIDLLSLCGYHCEELND